MKRFIAYWARGATYCNIPFQRMEITENVIFLYRDELIAQFDMGFVDLWYISESEQGKTSATT